MRINPLFTLILFFILFDQFQVKSQVCAGTELTMTIQNTMKISGNVIEFDLWIANTGSTTFKIAGVTGSKFYDSGLLKVGSTGTYSIVPGDGPANNGFSTLNSLNISHSAANRNLRWTQSPASELNSVTITSTPVKFARLRFTSAPGVWGIPSTNISLVATAVAGVPACQITGYCNGNPNSSSVASGVGLILGAPVNIFLPVKLHSFSAEKVSERKARLSWSSSTEINSSHYEVERSFDAENFVKIGEIKAAGNSQSLLNYEFYDEKIVSLRTNQILYYRLKMIDLDGTFEYSDIRGLNFTNNLLTGVTMYPNPTSQILNLEINEVSFLDENGELQVFDATGQLIFAKKVIGSGIETIDMGSMTNGVYHVVFTQGDQIFREKIVKID